MVESVIARFSQIRHPELACFGVWLAGNVAAQLLRLSVGSFQRLEGTKHDRELEDLCTLEIPVAVLGAKL